MGYTDRNKWSILYMLILSIDGIRADYYSDHCIYTLETIICKKADLHVILKFDLNESILTIDLSENEIEEIRDGTFHNMPNVKYLQLFANRIIDIEEKAFWTLTELTYLDLSDNLLEDFSTDLLANNRKMMALDLSQNNFITPPLLNVSSLMKLNLAGNKIHVFLERHLLGLPNLRELDLRQNNLRSADPQMFLSAPNLISIDLSDNSWECSCETVGLIYELVVRNVTEDRSLFCLENGKYINIFDETGFDMSLCDTPTFNPDTRNDTKLLNSMSSNGSFKNSDSGKYELTSSEDEPILTTPQIIVIAINAFLLVCLAILIYSIISHIQNKRQNQRQIQRIREDLKYVNIQQ